MQRAQTRTLNDPVTVLPTVGPARAEKLALLGIRTLRDLLFSFPTRHEDRSVITPIEKLVANEEGTIRGTVEKIATRRGWRRRRLIITEARVVDDTGKLTITWFNQPYLVETIPAGTVVLVHGKVVERRGKLTMNSPSVEPLRKKQIHTTRIVPVYPQTHGVSSAYLRFLTHEVLFLAARLREYLPEVIRDREQLVGIQEAVQQIHFPDSTDQLTRARARLAFDELFLLQLAALIRRSRHRRTQARAFSLRSAVKVTPPFSLTAAQRRVGKDIAADLARTVPMNRLVQGDVGSGKTVVAVRAAAQVLGGGAQVAFMAPTELLARQHHKLLGTLLPMKEKCALLIGALSANERAHILADLQQGSVRCVVGTHALFQKGVEFADLGLVIIDEQHRFGVSQRKALARPRRGSVTPHLLSLTATPIPRTLALTIYGDLDISRIDELPPGRLPILTELVKPEERGSMYASVRNAVRSGHQVYVVCPRIEEDPDGERTSVRQHAERLRTEVFPELRIAELHGKRSSDENVRVVEDFRDGKIDVLVATSMVEVGIDVPNATVMVIEGAEHFGLAQLHQFRGRIGRGRDASICFLVPGTDEAVEHTRLQAMTKLTDGLALAEEDLRVRGPGEIYGTRQSGGVTLKVASLADLPLIERTRAAAARLLTDDPLLHSVPRIRERVRTMNVSGHFE